jgi:hypothetical protein
MVRGRFGGYTALAIDQGHFDLQLAALGGKRCAPGPAQLGLTPSPWESLCGLCGRLGDENGPLLIYRIALCYEGLAPARFEALGKSPLRSGPLDLVISACTRTASV